MLICCYNRCYLFDYFNEDFVNFFLVENYSLIMVDIDYFKVINDMYGYIVGDKVLEEIVVILIYIVDDMGIVMCYGGEEFCIVLFILIINSVIDIVYIIKNKVSIYKYGDIEVMCSIGVLLMVFIVNMLLEFIE